MGSRHGKTMLYDNPPVVMASACIVGKKEGEGPLSATFDRIGDSEYFGEKTWEKAEARMQKDTAMLAMQKAGLTPQEIDLMLAGDLVNQCTPSTFGLCEFGVPYLGLFGACSTAAESMVVGSMLLDAGCVDTALCVTSSHFCTAERQFRYPLAYGGQRSPTAQWTVTGSGAFVLGKAGREGARARVRGTRVGIPVDLGISDASNMGAAMAPAAYDAISGFLRDTGSTPADFDLIATGDLGAVGHAIVSDLLTRDGYEIKGVYDDCGLMIFDRKRQDVHAGASGCACSAVVTAGHLMSRLRDGTIRNLLLVGTGALMSPMSFQQGENIVGIAHCVWLSAAV